MKLVLLTANIALLYFIVFRISIIIIIGTDHLTVMDMLWTRGFGKEDPDIPATMLTLFSEDSGEWILLYRWDATYFLDWNIGTNFNFTRSVQSVNKSNVTNLLIQEFRFMILLNSEHTFLRLLLVYFIKCKYDGFCGCLKLIWNESWERFLELPD